MIEVLRQMHSRHSWADVRDIILKIDSINNLGGQYLGAKGGPPALQANVAQPGANKNKTCDRCGRRGHIRSGCKTPKEKLKCDFCHSEGSHSTHACRQRKKAEKSGNKPPTDTSKKAIDTTRGRSPRRTPGGNTPRRQSPANNSSVACYRLREECSDSDIDDKIRNSATITGMCKHR